MMFVARYFKCFVGLVCFSLVMHVDAAAPRASLSSEHGVVHKHKGFWSKTWFKVLAIGLPITVVAAAILWKCRKSDPATGADASVPDLVSGVSSKKSMLSKGSAKDTQSEKLENKFVIAAEQARKDLRDIAKGDGTFADKINGLSNFQAPADLPTKLKDDVEYTRQELMSKTNKDDLKSIENSKDGTLLDKLARLRDYQPADALSDGRKESVKNERYFTANHLLQAQAKQFAGTDFFVNDPDFDCSVVQQKAVTIVEKIIAAENLLQACPIADGLIDLRGKIAREILSPLYHLEYYAPDDSDNSMPANFASHAARLAACKLLPQPSDAYFATINTGNFELQKRADIESFARMTGKILNKVLYSPEITSEGTFAVCDPQKIVAVLKDFDIPEWLQDQKSVVSEYAIYGITGKKCGVKALRKFHALPGDIKVQIERICGGLILLPLTGEPEDGTNDSSVPNNAGMNAEK